MRRRQVRVDRVHHRFVLVGAGDGEHLGVRALDHVGLGAEAAGDDHLSIRLDGFADGGEAFVAGGVEEAAGVDEHEVGAGIVGRDLVALGAQARDDAFRVDECLRATERNDADFRRLGRFDRGGSEGCDRHGGPASAKPRSGKAAPSRAADQLAVSSIPFSASRSFNSPFSNISLTMSQPPMNSPFT